MVSVSNTRYQTLLVVGGALALLLPRKYLNHNPPALSVAVLVKSEKGSMVLVKAKRKKKAALPTKFEEMFMHIFGQEEGGGMKSLYTDIDSKNRKGARGMTGKALTVFNVRKDPKTNKPRGATTKELNTLIAIGHHIEGLQGGDPESAASMQRLKSLGHFSDKLEDLLMNSAPVQNAAIQLGKLARQAQLDREENNELKGKTHHSTIDPETGIATRKPRTAFSPKEKNPDFLPQLLAGESSAAGDDSAARSLFSAGRDPLEDSTSTLTPTNTENTESRMTPDSLIAAQGNTEEKMPSHEELMEMYRLNQLGNTEEGDA